MMMASDLQVDGGASNQPDTNTSQDSLGQQKQRISLACQQCRSRKRRCDGEKPICSSCVLSGQSACQYPVVQKRRGAGKTKQNIKALENRLLELESKILSAQHQDGTTSKCSDQVVPPDPSPSGPASESLKTAQTTMTALQPISCTPTHSHIHLPNHPKFRRMFNQIAEMKARSVDFTCSFRSMLASPSQIHEVDISLLSGSVEQIFQEFPICENAEFLDRARNQAIRGTEIPGYAAQWTCVNAAIALATHVKTANCSFEELSHWSWTYFKNAYATLPELILHGNGIESLQAVVLMAVFARNSADARMVSHLVSTALRLSQTLDPRVYMANHNEGCKDSMESEHARRALWSAFILDTDLALPSGLDPGDMGIALPSGGELHSDYTSDVAIFRWRAELALIQTSVKKRLYTHHALEMPSPELLSTITNLDQQLELWRQSLPPELRPGATPPDPEPHCLALHLDFHNIVSMVHWARRRHIQTEAEIPDQLDRSRLKVRTAAQNILCVLHSPHPEPFSQFWRNLSYPLSAAFTLLLYILEDDPKDLQAKADTTLIKQYGDQVKNMHNSGDFDLSALLQAWHGLEQIADAAAVGYSENDNDQTSQDHSVISGIDTPQTMKQLLNSATHPMYLAQGLLTNLPNRDIEITESIAAILLGVSWEESKPYGPLVPRCVKPATYGFGFGGRVD